MVTEGIGAYRLPLGAPGVRDSAAPAPPPPGATDTETAVGEFTDALSEAVDSVNAEHAKAEGVVGEFLQGGDVPVHQVMIALSQADLTMRLATAVTSRAIAAYQEIARMQV
jgi:flagellar hook-basal body complex protein FliE